MKMEDFVKEELQKRGYSVNEEALSYIKICDDWYSNHVITDFHKRKTIQGVEYEMERMNFAKRCCSDDANLCEVIEINAGEGKQNDDINKIIRDSNFDVMYRKQLERTSAIGTVACYIRLENASLVQDGEIQKVRGGNIKLNYVNGDSFIPLTVDNENIVEAAFSGSDLRNGKKITTLVMFLKEKKNYKAETIVFDEKGKRIDDLHYILDLGPVKPFAVMRNAEVNNIDNMIGYGLPKIYGAIPSLKVVDLAFNVLNSDLDKAEKILLVNELLCQFDRDGKPKLTPEQKKIFVLLGEKLPQEKSLIQEYNPEIRIDAITKSLEIALSLLSMSFGYGTKKYSFENGKISTATEFVLSRQDSMQELNRQRQEARKYIQDICKAVIWFSNTFNGTSYNQDVEIKVEFDDSLVTDKATELERKRNDALSFEIPQLTVWYLMDAYNLTEEEAKALMEQKQEEKDPEEED